MKKFLLLLLLSATLLFWVLNTLSISYDEALKIHLAKTQFVDLASVLSLFSMQIFEASDLSLRIPFLLLYICNATLMFYFAKGFSKRENDAFLCALIFCLLPGVNASALLVLNSGIVIFFTLIFCIILQRTNKVFYPLLILLCFVDEGFALLFLALIFYGISRRDTALIFIALSLFAVSMYLFKLNIGGHPSAYFLDNNGHLALIFSPLLFLYFIYTLYRYFNAENKPFIWYLACVTLAFIWILSLRQRVQTEDFAPFLLVALPLMISLYLSGLRVRLPQFRLRYKIPFIATFLVLILTSGILLFSKPLYLLLSDANSHFAKRHFLAKELAQSLKDNKITSVRTDDKLQLRLAFYGIKKGGGILSEKRLKNAKAIPIIIYDKHIATYYYK